MNEKLPQVIEAMSAAELEIARLMKENAALSMVLRCADEIINGYLNPNDSLLSREQLENFATICTAQIKKRILK
jgi:hypothetical protein